MQSKTNNSIIETDNPSLEDSIPLETPWHRAEVNLLIESLNYYWRDFSDYFVGGDMYLYYCRRQVRNRDYRGPSFFVVKDVDGTRERDTWVVWEEDGRYPDLIIELLSSKTAETDVAVKKLLYERTFRTPEYFCYNSVTQELSGWQLQNRFYEKIKPDKSGYLWSDVLLLSLGTWLGKFMEKQSVWLRFFDKEGQIIQIRVEAETERAEKETAAREAAEIEVARLQEELKRLKNNADSSD